MKFLLAHPQLVIGAFPFVLAAVVGAISKAEKWGLTRLLSVGDATDQEAVRATAAIWVKWAEKKVAAGGPAKFLIVDQLVKRFLPFLSADQRRDLIEGAVKEMDAAANISLQTPPSKPWVPPAADAGSHTGGL